MQEVALNIDFGPTFVDIAGQITMPNVDGITLMPILHPNSNQTQPLRQAFLVEHQGEYTASQPGCPQYKDQDMSVSSFCYMILGWGLNIKQSMLPPCWDVQSTCIEIKISL